jgi:uncharacterized protein
MSDCRPGIDAICKETPHFRNIMVKDRLLYVEVADSPIKRTVGLMYRETLKKNTGMLFDFPENSTVRFWMKNTRMSLDMIFAREDGIIIYIEHRAPICDKDPCPTYGPSDPYRYVVETHGGFAKKHDIRVGDLVTFP